MFNWKDAKPGYVVPVQCIGIQNPDAVTKHGLEITRIDPVRGIEGRLSDTDIGMVSVKGDGYGTMSAKLDERHVCCITPIGEAEPAPAHAD